MGKRKTKKAPKKIHLIFDEHERREFLTGFSKRKTERKKKAQDKIVRRAREEKRLLKAERREILKSLVGGEVDPVPQGTEPSEKPVTYDMPEHLVTVTSLDDATLFGNVCVGNNEFVELDSAIADAEEIDAKKQRIRELEQKMAECSQTALEKLRHSRKKRKKSRKKGKARDTD